MKRLVTFICLILVIFVGYILIAKGFDNSVFPIASYKTIESKHEALTKKLANYDRLNQDEFENSKLALDSLVKIYNGSKNKYETLLAELENTLKESNDNGVSDMIYSDQEVYKIDFLLVTLGNYAKQEGVETKMELSSSSITNSTASMLEYFFADMNFQVSGQYINVANFISHLENDEKLSWEITNFEMGSGEDCVNASFVVKDIPIDSKSYLATKVTDFDEDEDEEDDDDDSEKNVTNVVNNTANSVDNKNTTNTTTNTVSNTVSNTEN